MPIYTVTYCTMDTEVPGTNPLWHTFILLSRFNEETRELEVVDNWGFYGQPTTNGESYLRDIKRKIGLDVDLYGNHGWLRHEEGRFLDLGCGLHGITFQVSEDKFFALQRRCQKVAEEQEKPYLELFSANNGMKITPLPEGKYRIHPWEQYSSLVYPLELAAAQNQNRESRLKPFAFFSYPQKTCKTQALNLLDGIITDEQYESIAGDFASVSRFSGDMEDIYLDIQGPLSRHVKNNGDTVYYHDLKTPGTKMRWTVLPQLVDTSGVDPDGKPIDLFGSYDDHTAEVKQLVRKLRKLEWLFRNARLDESLDADRHQLITRIVASYRAFGQSNPNSSEETMGGLAGQLYWMMAWPRDLHEHQVMEQIANTNHFIDAIYKGLTKENDPSYLNLAASLPEEKQIELCNILNYPAPDPEEDEYLEVAHI